MSKQLRSLIGGLAAVVVLSGALAPTPAAGKTSRGCPKYKPAPPQASPSAKAQEVPKLPVTRITDGATEENPVVIDFEQGTAVWWYAYNQGRGPIVDDNHYFNVQVDTKKKLVGLHVRIEWPLLAEEIDMYMYDEYGYMDAWSEAFNQIPAEVTGDTGGPGYEYIPGYPAPDCRGFTIEAMAMWTTPQTATLKLWLGPVEWEG